MAKIEQLTFHIADVMAKTRWSFVEVRDSDGRTGTGEASLLGREVALTTAFEQVAAGFIAADAAPRTMDAHGIPADPPAAAILSALVRSAKQRAWRSPSLLPDAISWKCSKMKRHTSRDWSREEAGLCKGLGRLNLSDLLGSQILAPHRASGG